MRVIADVAIFPVRGRRRKCADARRSNAARAVNMYMMGGGGSALASAARCRELHGSCAHSGSCEQGCGDRSAGRSLDLVISFSIWQPITRIVCLADVGPRCYGTRQPILEHDHASTRLPADRFRLKAAREGRKSHAEMSPEMVRIAKGLRRRKRGKFTGADRRCCWHAGGPKYPPPVRSIFEQSKQQRRLSRCRGSTAGRDGSLPFRRTACAGLRCRLARQVSTCGSACRARQSNRA